MREPPTDLEEDAENYRKFYECFSKNIKLGIHGASQNWKKLPEWLCCCTPASGDEGVSLREYGPRVKENQKHIHFTPAETNNQVANSKHLWQHDWEVIRTTEPMADTVKDLTAEGPEGETVVSVTKEGLGLPEDKEEKRKTARERQCLKTSTQL